MVGGGGTCMVGGHAWQGGSVAGGHVWQGEGACMIGGVHGRGVCMPCDLSHHALGCYLYAVPAPTETETAM